MASLGRCCHYYLHHELSPCQALASESCPSPAAQQVTTHSTCLSSNLQVAQSSISEPVLSASLNGNEKLLPWNRPLPFHGLSYSSERKKWRYWRVAIEGSCPLPMLQFPCYVWGGNISPQSTVWIEQSLSAQPCHHHRLLTHHCTYCCVFSQPWLKSRMKSREAHTAHRHSLPSLLSPSQLKCDKKQFFAINCNRSRQ